MFDDSLTPPCKICSKQMHFIYVQLFVLLHFLYIQLPLFSVEIYMYIPKHGDFSTEIEIFRMNIYIYGT